ncbi:hypothetical protein AKO1_007713 [Acrasis kona]|uniref:RGS domain-containing protein n=1 Tax=Acrasis kona TaxID=1008807 RepID=A0AAW2YRZ4_9EUKA
MLDSLTVTSPPGTCNTPTYDSKILEEMITNTGRSVDDISQHHKILLVFLRHTGCVFCQEAIRDIFDIYPVMMQLDTVAIFVHMETPNFFSKYLEELPEERLKDFVRVYDKDNRFADAFKVVNEASLGYQNITRGIELLVTRGIMVKSVHARDGAVLTRKPAVFLIEKGDIVHEFRVGAAHEKPDYLSVIIDPQFEGRASEATCCDMKAMGTSDGVLFNVTKKEIDDKKPKPKSRRTKSLTFSSQCLPVFSDMDFMSYDAHDVGLAMRDTRQRRYIKLYAAKIYCTETVLFWETVEIQYKNAIKRSVRAEMAEKIFVQFFDPNSLHGINVTDVLKNKITNKYKQEGADNDLFEDMIIEVEATLLREIYTRFMESDLYKKMCTKYLKPTKESKSTCNTPRTPITPNIEFTETTFTEN